MNKSTRKNIISAIITILILMGGLLAFRMLAAQKKSTVTDKVVKKERRKVQISSFDPESYDNQLAIDGRLKAQERVDISAKVQGLLLETGKTIREGMYFKKGDLLFNVDAEEVVLNLKAQKSNMMTTIAQMMPDLKFDYPASFDAWQKYLNEFDVNQSIKELPQPKSEQEKYFVAGKNLYNQFYTIKSAERSIQDYKIAAPFSGVITAVNVHPGAMISPSQTLATMINTSTYEVVAPVSLESLSYIKSGQSVQLSADDINQTWTGRISRIGTQIDNATQNIPLYISVNGKGLKDGMYLKGNINAKAIDNVYKLPKEIFISPEEIFVVIDSTLISKKVSPIKRGGDYIIVSGINVTDKIVSGSLAGLFEGQKVTY